MDNRDGQEREDPLPFKFSNSLQFLVKFVARGIYLILYSLHVFFLRQLYLLKKKNVSHLAKTIKEFEDFNGREL